MSVHDLTDQLPKRPDIVINSADVRAPGANPFWAAGIGVGVNVILSQLDDIDAMSQRIGAVPDRSFPKRAVVADYLDTIRDMAGAWLRASRPQLLATLRDLRRAALQVEAMAGSTPAEVAHMLRQHLDAPAGGLETLNTDIGGYLEHMALASGELETDTVLVTHRLQADQVHAAMLSQQLQTLQEQVGQARSRQHVQWPLGAQVEQLRRTLTAKHDALDSTRRQLDRIRAAQADTLLEAAFLQQLLPMLSNYLAGVDRMGAGIDAALLGMRALTSRLGDAAAPPGNLTREQLDAASAHWRHLAARLDDALGREGAAG